MSAEERLAALRDVRTALHVHCSPTSRCNLPPGYEDAVIASLAEMEGVSVPTEPGAPGWPTGPNDFFSGTPASTNVLRVPTEPGAPDPADWTLTFVARGNPPRPVLVGISPHPAKAPVPALDRRAGAGVPVSAEKRRRPYVAEIGANALVRRADGSVINFGDALYHPDNVAEARAFAAGVSVPTAPEPSARLREAAQELLDANAAPDNRLSWVIESQEARAEGRPNRAIAANERVAKAWAELRAALAATPQDPGA